MVVQHCQRRFQRNSIFIVNQSKSKMILKDQKLYSCHWDEVQGNELWPPPPHRYLKPDAVKKTSAGKSFGSKRWIRETKLPGVDSVEGPQVAHAIGMMSDQYRCDVIPSHRIRFDVMCQLGKAFYRVCYLLVICCPIMIMRHTFCLKWNVMWTLNITPACKLCWELDIRC